MKFIALSLVVLLIVNMHIICAAPYSGQCEQCPDYFDNICATLCEHGEDKAITFQNDCFRRQHNCLSGENWLKFYTGICKKDLEA